MTNLYNPSTLYPIYDPFVLIGNSSMMTGYTGLIYSVQLNESEEKNYLVISHNDTGGYPYSNQQCLLIYYN